jgi:hypothetical protein
LGLILKIENDFKKTTKILNWVGEEEEGDLCLSTRSNRRFQKIKNPHIKCTLMDLYQNRFRSISMVFDLEARPHAFHLPSTKTESTGLPDRYFKKP